MEVFEQARQGKEISEAFISGPSSMDFKSSSGLSLDTYEIIDKLGKGSFGSVFLVRRRADPTGKFFAMKVLDKYKVF